jgi:hypothetical protein
MKKWFEKTLGKLRFILEAVALAWGIRKLLGIAGVADIRKKLFGSAPNVGECKVRRRGA